jgi:hypothetical protein
MHSNITNRNNGPVMQDAARLDGIVFSRTFVNGSFGMTKPTPYITVWFCRNSVGAHSCAHRTRREARQCRKGVLNA